ncbi:hypothetical protein [Sphingomonas morindae]|uniref:Uncharacterized protein n=1 Tax=Sphingomonas morindae TaxID=1541170 RepID=A0ABY4XCS3_9SPHN|nr:hypothetical protein [Sphingomonas morindae]USI74639.1 hypothetical protein LHA26_14755 [Sphingomonas morindae]
MRSGKTIKVSYALQSAASPAVRWKASDRPRASATDLAKHIVEGESLSAALDVIAAGGAVLKKIAVTCRKVRVPRLPAGWRLLNETPDPLARSTGFHVVFDEIAPFTFDLGFDALRFGQPYHGLQLKDGSDVSAPYPALRSRLIEKDLPTARTHAWWIWWTYADEIESGVRPGDPADVWRAFTDKRWADFLLIEAIDFEQRLTEVGALPRQSRPRFRKS